MTAAVASAQHHSASRGVSTATQTGAPVIDYVVPALAVNYVAPAPVIEDMPSALVFEYVAPAPAVTLSVPSQQLPPAYTMTTDTADDNFDITSLVNPQFSCTAVEDVSPLVVGSLLPLKEFDAPVYNQIHQEQVVAGMATKHRVQNPAVQGQVIIQEIPQVSTGERIQEQIVASAPLAVGSLPTLEEFDAPLFNQIHQEQIVAGETTQNTFENPAVHEQVIVQEIPQAPQVVDSFPPSQEFVAPMCNQVLQEQIVASVRPHVLQEIHVVQIVERIQEQIVEPIDVMIYAALSQQLPFYH